MGWEGQYSHYIITVKSVLGFCGMGWDGQYSHYIITVKSVLGFCGMGWAVFALHYNSAFSVVVLWDG